MPVPSHVIDVLKNNVRDIARSNRFEVTLNRKGNGQGKDVDKLNITQNLIRSVEVPATTIDDVIIKRMGRKIVMPGAVDFAQNLLMNIHNDVDGKTRKYIQSWQEDYYGKIGAGLFNEVGPFLQGTVDVYQLDNQNRRTAKFTFSHAYPKTFGGADLNNENDDHKFY